MNRKPLELIITNERICNFYHNNPMLHFENINMCFIDLFDSILKDFTTTNTSIQSLIIDNIQQNTNKINELNTTLISMKENINVLILNITTKINTVKLEYIDQTRFTFNKHENILSWVEQNTDTCFKKIIDIIVQEIDVKPQDHILVQIQEIIRPFKKMILEECRQYLHKYPDKTHPDINPINALIQNIDIKINGMIANLQQPIYSFLLANEELLHKNVVNSKDNMVAIQQKLINELSDALVLLKREKGFMSPNNILQTNFNSDPRLPNDSKKERQNLIGILNKIYMTGDISVVHQPTMMFSRNSVLQRVDINREKTDTSSQHLYLVKRPNKYNILIETHDVEQNVNTNEIRQFIQTMEENNCNGVLLSQQSGFSCKSNYHIEIYNKLIIVYVHNVEYDPEKIKNAIDIIDNLTIKLREMDRDENIYEIIIDKDVLEEINKEYQLFIQQKDNVLSAIKESHKKVLSQIDDFKFPELDKYLSTKFSVPIQKQGFKCDLCKKFNATNLKALAAHKRGCFRKNSKKITEDKYVSNLPSNFSTNDSPPKSAV